MQSLDLLASAALTSTSPASELDCSADTLTASVSSSDCDSNQLQTSGSKESESESLITPVQNITGYVEIPQDIDGGCSPRSCRMATFSNFKKVIPSTTYSSAFQHSTKPLNSKNVYISESTQKRGVNQPPMTYLNPGTTNHFANMQFPSSYFGGTEASAFPPPLPNFGYLQSSGMFSQVVAPTPMMGQISSALMMPNIPSSCFHACSAETTEPSTEAEATTVGANRFPTNLPSTTLEFSTLIAINNRFLESATGRGPKLSESEHMLLLEILSASRMFPTDRLTIKHYQ